MNKKFSIFSFGIAKHVVLAGLLEFGPVFIFLVAFESFHIYKATIILMMATIISTIATFRIQKRLPYLALYVALLTSIFGYITLTLHAPRFIQMRDTLYDATCALTLIAGLMVNVSFLKLAFHKVIPMSNKAWTQLTYYWIGFFITLATLNEYVRRTVDLAQWFDFKGLMVLATVLFGCLSLFFIYENEEEVNS